MTKPVVIRILGDAAGLKGSLNESEGALGAFSARVENIGQKMSDLGKKMSVAVTLPVAAAGAGAFKMAADLEDAIGASEQIFRDSAGAVQGWAKELESFYGISRSEAMEHANMMGAMLKNIGGLTEEEAAKTSGTLVELAGDLTAMFGGTTEDAVRALTGALKGNNTMLDNYGMSATDAQIKAKALEMGIWNGKGAMDAQEKQAATLALIMEQSADAQGQAAREAEGASGSMRAFSTDIKNLATDIGMLLLPVGTKLVGWAKDLIAWVRELSPVWQQVIVAVAGVAAAAGPMLIVGGKILTWAVKLKPLLAALTGPVGLVALALVGIGIALYQAYQRSEEFRAVVGDLAGAAKQVFDILFKGDFTGGPFSEDSKFVDILFKARDVLIELVGIGQRVAAAFGEGGLGAAARVAAESLGDLWRRAAPVLGEFLTKLGAWLWNTALPAIVEAVAGWGAALVEWVAPRIPPLLREVGKLLGKLLEWLWSTALPQLLIRIGEWAVAFVEWVAPIIPPLLVELAKLLGSLLRWILTEALPRVVGDLAKVGAEFFKWVAPQIPPLLVELGKLLGRMASWVVTDAIPRMAREFGSMGVKLGSALLDKLIEEFKKLPGRIADAAKGFSLGGIGRTIADRLNPFGDGLGMMSSGGGSFGAGAIKVSGRTVAGGTWQQLLNMAASTGIGGITASSVFRPGSITRSGNMSYHARGRAVDLVAPSLARLQIALQRFGPQLRELIGPIPSLNWHNGRPHRYSQAVQNDHYDHVHMAYDRGGYLPPGIHTIANFTGKPEPILTDQQWQALKNRPVFHIENYYGNRSLAEEARFAVALHGRVR